MYALELVIVNSCNYYIGIDPGLNGAMVLMRDKDGEHIIIEAFRFSRCKFKTPAIEVNPMKKKYVNALDYTEIVRKLSEWKSSYDPVIATIEGIYDNHSLIGQTYLLATALSEVGITFWFALVQTWKRFVLRKYTSGKLLVKDWVKKKGYNWEILGNHTDSFEAVGIGRCGYFYWQTAKERGYI